MAPLYQLATFRRAPIKTPSARSQRTSKGMVKRAPSEETAEGQHETADEAAMEVTENGATSPR